MYGTYIMHPFCILFSAWFSHYSKFPSVWGCMHNSCAFQTFSPLLFTFGIYSSHFFLFLHFPPNIAHPSDVKQRIKPPKRDHRPCNLAKQMTNTRCFSEMLSVDGSRCLRWQLACTTKCITLMATKARRGTLLSFPFTLRWLLTPEMLVLMGNRR